MNYDPSASPHLGIATHLRKEASLEAQAAAISALSQEILRDALWLNTLEDRHPDLDERKNALRDAVLHGNRQEIEVAIADLNASYRVAAHKLAAIELERDRAAALEDAALAAYESRMECE